MAHKRMTVQLPPEIVEMFNPLFRCLRETPPNQNGERGGLILDLHESGRCEAAFFTIDDFLNISTVVENVINDGEEV